MTISNAQSIEVQNVQGELLVDSRLIASTLEVEHRYFFRTLTKYLTLIEQFGQLRFENATVTNSVGASNTAIFAMLNEDQATFLMTLSKNTEAVVQAKISLVKAFSLAKKILNPSTAPIEAMNAQIALEFESKTYRPWMREFPDADRCFRGNIGIPQAILLEGAVEPEPLPSDRMLQVIDSLSLAANRAGLAGNKSTKEAEFLEQQLRSTRTNFREMENLIARQKQAIDFHGSDLATTKAMLQRANDRIQHLEQVEKVDLLKKWAHESRVRDLESRDASQARKIAELEKELNECKHKCVRLANEHLSHGGVEQLQVTIGGSTANLTLPPA